MLETARAALYPVLPLRDIVVFPHMIVPLFVAQRARAGVTQELEAVLAMMPVAPLNLLPRAGRDVNVH